MREMQSATPFHTLHGIQETAESRKRCGHWWSPGNFCHLPFRGWGGVCNKGKREELHKDESHVWESIAATKGHLWPKPGFEILTEEHFLTLLSIAFPHLPHDNWGYFLHTFSSQVEQRNMLKASGTAGSKRDRNRERDGRKEAQIFQGVYSCFLSFLPQSLHGQLPPPKHSGLGQVLLGAGHACSLQGDTGCCLAWSCISRPLEVAFPVGYTGKLVLLLNSKAREIPSKTLNIFISHLCLNQMRKNRCWGEKEGEVRFKSSNHSQKIKDIFWIAALKKPAVP